MAKIRETEFVASVVREELVMLLQPFLEMVLKSSQITFLVAAKLEEGVKPKSALCALSNPHFEHSFSLQLLQPQ